MNAGRGNNFDLLRLIFAGAVIFSHSFEMQGLPDPIEARYPFTIGTLALGGFFIVSGALITRSWRADPNVGRFAARRALRIVPGFWVATLFSIFVAGWIGAANPERYLSDVGWGWIPRALVLVEPMTSARSFAGTPWPIVNGPMWTIDFEVACYALTPVVITLCRTRWIYLAAWAVLAIEGVVWPHGDVIRLFLMFLSGALIARAEFTRVRVWQAGLALAAALLLPPIGDVLFATAGAWLILRFGRAAAVVRLPADISYGVYLYGWPVGKVLAWEGVTNPWVLCVLTLPLAAGLGWLSWRLVERPCLKVKPVRPVPERRSILSQV